VVNPFKGWQFHSKERPFKVGSIGHSNWFPRFFQTRVVLIQFQKTHSEFTFGPILRVGPIGILNGYFHVSQFPIHGLTLPEISGLTIPTFGKMVKSPSLPSKLPF